MPLYVITRRRLLPCSVTLTSRAYNDLNVLQTDPLPVIPFPHVELNGDVMKRLSEEKLKNLAEKSGWSIARAQGYLAGETSRRNGTVPTTYALIGFDDYCVGFRAGFFERTSQRSTHSDVRRTQLVDAQPSQGALKIAPGEKTQAYLMRLERRSDPLRRAR